ncbi:MAG: hypothetical protein REI64_14050 [Pedobacter sp.]|nr:hypothetical protein [Pedobacter sp.]MDQ8005921.1 hypothetical protein [Pedobacter sp.]
METSLLVYNVHSHSLYQVYKEKGNTAKAKEYAEALNKTTAFGDKGLYKL